MRIGVFGVRLLAMMMFLCALHPGYTEITNTGNRVNGDTVDGGHKKKDNQDHNTSMSPTISTRSIPSPPLSDFAHAIDGDFVTQIWQIKSEIQTGKVPGHYLRINGGTVSADATRTNNKAQFKIHCYYDDRRDEELWMFESAFEKGKFIAIVNDRVVVQRVRIPLKSIVHVKATHPGILFDKKPLSPGSTIFTLRLYRTSARKKYLGFNKEKGSVMVPSKVRPWQTEAKLRLV